MHILKVKQFGIHSRYNSGFSLAEVLITLTIIGVVAAITISNLIQKQQEQRTVAALKKAYSTLTNAYTLAVKDYGTPDYWEIAETEVGAENMLNKLAPNLNLVKNCGRNTGCFKGKYYRLNNSEFGPIDEIPIMAKAELADGSILATWGYDSARYFGDSLSLEDVYGEYHYDINGQKGPNTWGKDTFLFLLTKRGIVPAGTAETTNGFVFAEDCKPSNAGYSCTAWVIYNENMDYLRCSSKISWNGKHTCD